MPCFVSWHVTLTWSATLLERTALAVTVFEQTSCLAWRCKRFDWLCLYSLSTSVTQWQHCHNEHHTNLSVIYQYCIGLFAQVFMCIQVGGWFLYFILFVFSRCSVRFTFVNVLFILLSVTWYVFMVIANGCVIIMDVSTVVMPMKYIHVYMPNEEWGRNKKLIRWYWVLNLTTCDCQRKWYHKCTWWYSKKYDLLERS